MYKDMAEIPKGNLPGYDITSDRARADVFDETDSVVDATTKKKVEWSDPDFQAARNNWVRDNTLASCAQGLQQIRATLEPAVRGSKAPRVSEEQAKKALLRALEAVRPEIEDLISDLQAVVDDPDSLGALRSDAQLLIAGLRGQIATCDSGATTGKAALTPLREALRSNPDNSVAWSSYAVAMLNVHLNCPTGFKRKFAELVLFGRGKDNNIEGELNRTIRNLARFPEHVPCQVMLHELLEMLEHDPKGVHSLDTEQCELLTDVRERMQQWMKDPAMAEAIALAKEGFAVEVPRAEI